MLGDIRRIRKEKQRKQHRRLVRRVERGFLKLETCFEEMRLFSTQFDCSIKVLKALADDLDGSCDESFLLEVLDSKTHSVKYDKQLFCQKCRSGEHFEELLTQVTEIYSENGEDRKNFAQQSHERAKGKSSCRKCQHEINISVRGTPASKKDNPKSQAATTNHIIHSFSNNEHEDIIISTSEPAKTKNLLFPESRNETQSINESELIEEQRDQISMNLIKSKQNSKTQGQKAHKPEHTWGELIDIKDATPQNPSKSKKSNKTSIRKLSDFDSSQHLRDSLAKKNLFRFDSDENKEVYSGNQSPNHPTIESLTSPNLLSSRVLYSEDRNSKEAQNHASIDPTHGFNSLIQSKKNNKNNLSNNQNRTNPTQTPNQENDDQEKNKFKIEINGGTVSGSKGKGTGVSDVSKTEEGEVVNDSEFERRMFGNRRDTAGDKRLDKRITFGADMIAAHFGSYDSRKNPNKKENQDIGISIFILLFYYFFLI